MTKPHFSEDPLSGQKIRIWSRSSSTLQQAPYVPGDTWMDRRVPLQDCGWRWTENSNSIPWNLQMLWHLVFPQGQNTTKPIKSFPKVDFCQNVHFIWAGFLMVPVCQSPAPWAHLCISWRAKKVHLRSLHLPSLETSIKLTHVLSKVCFRGNILTTPHRLYEITVI